MPEWLMGADCKSADERLRWFKSSSAQLVWLYHEAKRGLFFDGAPSKASGK